VGLTRHALSPDPNVRGHFHGTSACLSALFSAQRYDEIVDIVRVDTIWPYKQRAVKALVTKGEKAEAIRYAESCGGRGLRTAAWIECVKRFSFHPVWLTRRTHGTH